MGRQTEILIIFMSDSRSSSDLTRHLIRWGASPRPSLSGISNPIKPAASLASYHLFNAAAFLLNSTLPRDSFRNRITASTTTPHVIDCTQNTHRHGRCCATRLATSGPIPVPNIAAPANNAMGVFLSLELYRSLMTPPIIDEKTEEPHPARKRATTIPARLGVSAHAIWKASNTIPAPTKTG